MRRLPFLFVFALAAGCGGRGPVTVPEAAELKKLPPGTHQQTADVPGVDSVKYTVEVQGERTSIMRRFEGHGADSPRSNRLSVPGRRITSLTGSLSSGDRPPLPEVRHVRSRWPPAPQP
jgi:predicted small lipoprotein YifL